MDDYMFGAHVQGCRNVVESTSYLEIFNYSVGPARNLQTRGLAPGRRDREGRTLQAADTGADAYRTAPATPTRPRCR